MISRAVSEREHLTATVSADKGVVIFCKSFLFHKHLLKLVIVGKLTEESLESYSVAERSVKF